MCGPRDVTILLRIGDNSDRPLVLDTPSRWARITDTS